MREIGIVLVVVICKIIHFIHSFVGRRTIGDLKQARSATATVVNKQLNVIVKNKLYWRMLPSC